VNAACARDGLPEQARALVSASLAGAAESAVRDDLALAARHPSPAGAWSVQDWADYLGLKRLVPAAVRRWIGAYGRPGARLYDLAGWALFGVAWAASRLRSGWRGSKELRAAAHRGPDGTHIVLNGLPIPGNAATTYGNVVHIGTDPGEGEPRRALLNHEYVHVLQVRRDGALFLVRYLWASWRAVRHHQHRYWANAYEVQAYAVERHLAAHPFLPDVWDLPRD